MKILHLRHHRHTAKLIGHEHTSYVGMAIIIVIAGLSFSTVRAYAASYDVSARVSAPLPVSSAEIVSPINGVSTGLSSVAVTGTCPHQSPQIMVVILRNGTYAGSVTCSLSGTFIINISLITSQNLLLPKVVNITDDYGPDGTAITLNYTPPSSTQPLQLTTPNSPSPTIPSPTPNAPLLILDQIENYVLYRPDVGFELQFNIQNGQAPYAVTIDWGDGTKDSTIVTGSRIKLPSHTYRDTLPYTITLGITDAKGQTATLQVAARTVRHDIYSPGVILGTIPVAPIEDYIARTIWQSYAVITTGLVAIWAIEHSANLKKAKLGTVSNQAARRTTRARKKNS